jgi:hypothetical protein
VNLATAEAGRDLDRLFEDWFYTTAWYEAARTGTTVEEFIDRYGRRQSE